MELFFLAIVKPLPQCEGEMLKLDVNQGAFVQMLMPRKKRIGMVPDFLREPFLPFFFSLGVRIQLSHLPWLENKCISSSTTPAQMYPHYQYGETEIG